MQTVALQGVEPLDELAMVARIHQQAKAVVEISRAMNVAAVNAMLTAKQVGVRGFHVAAGEMRAFGQRLEDVMQVLKKAIFELVRNVACLCKEQRQLRYLPRAQEKSAPDGVLLGSAIALCGRRMSSGAHAGGSEWAALCRELSRASKLTHLALMLGRSAEVEAVHGGTMTAALKQVAEDIDATARRILDGVKALGTEIHARTATRWPDDAFRRERE